MDPEAVATHPRVFDWILTAHRNRVRRLSVWLRDARLEPVEELLGYLDARVSVYRQETRAAAAMTYLVHRLRGDFSIGIDSLLSGLFVVCSEAMRDVIEIEMLLQDFADDHSRFDLWKNADAKLLRKEFEPKELKRRRSNRLGIPIQDLPGREDYAAHSLIVHLNPGLGPLAERSITGLVPEDLLRTGFSDLLQHGSSVLVTLAGLEKSLVPHILAGSSPTVDAPHLMVAAANERELHAVALGVERAIRKGFREDGKDVEVTLMEDGIVLVADRSTGTLEQYAIEGGLDLQRVARGVADMGASGISLTRVGATDQ